MLYSDVHQDSAGACSVDINSEPYEHIAFTSEPADTEPEAAEWAQRALELVA